MSACNPVNPVHHPVRDTLPGTSRPDPVRVHKNGPRTGWQVVRRTAYRVGAAEATA